ncbi:hypothetical protein [Adlercreutzia rubneri]
MAQFRFERTLTGFAEEYRAAHPEGKVVSEQRLDALGDFVRTHARQLLG